MHGDKRWIKDYRGRLKKSSDKTYKDKLGNLNSFEQKPWRARKRCVDCQEKSAELGPNTWGVECEYHQYLSHILYHTYKGNSSPPKWFRTLKNRKVRSHNNQIVRQGNRDDDQYEKLVPLLKDSSRW